MAEELLRPKKKERSLPRRHANNREWMLCFNMTRERFLDTWEPSRTSNLLYKPRLSSLLSVDDIGRELFRTAPGIDIGNRAERLVRGDENRRARERRRSVAAGRQGR